MDILVFGLSVALIGMSVVFVGLVILIGSIKLITFFSQEKKPKGQEESQAEIIATEENILMDAPLVGADETSPEIIAAITAAIAAMWQGDTGFVVRHVRRVHNAPAWNRAGRDDQVYSRM